MMSQRRMPSWLFSKRNSAKIDGSFKNINDTLPEEEHHQYQHQTSRCTGQPTKQGDGAQSADQNHHAPLHIQLSLGKPQQSKYFMKLTKHSYKLYIIYIYI